MGVFGLYLLLGVALRGILLGLALILKDTHDRTGKFETIDKNGEEFAQFEMDMLEEVGSRFNLSKGATMAINMIISYVLWPVDLTLITLMLIRKRNDKG